MACAHRRQRPCHVFLAGSGFKRFQRGENVTRDSSTSASRIRQTHQGRGSSGLTGPACKRCKVPCHRELRSTACCMDVNHSRLFNVEQQVKLCSEAMDQLRSSESSLYFLAKQTKLEPHSSKLQSMFDFSGSPTDKQKVYDIRRQCSYCIPNKP